MNVAGGSREYSALYATNLTVEDEIIAAQLTATNASFYRFYQGTPAIFPAVFTTPVTVLTADAGEIGIIHVGRASSGANYQHSAAMYSYVGGVGLLTVLGTNPSSTITTLTMTGNIIEATSSTSNTLYVSHIRFN